MAIQVQYPAGSRDTRLRIAEAPIGTTRTQWEFTPTNESSFIVTTTSSGSDAANISSADLRTLKIWLPPLYVYTVRTRYHDGTAWGSWTSQGEVTARGPLNSYEKYLALSGLSGVDNV